MSNDKMREALEYVLDKLGADDYGDWVLTSDFDPAIIEEALATPKPERQEAPELTDEEIVAIAKATQSAEPGRDGYVLPFTFARAVIAADRAKRGVR